jgi:hypothetical protein
MIETLRYEGPYYIFLRLLPIGFSPFGSLGLLKFYQRDLTGPLRRVQPKVEIEICQAGECDIDELSRLVRIHYAHSTDLEFYAKLGIRDTILQRFQRGARCFVAKIGGEIVHYNWIFFRLEEIDPGLGRFLRLEDDEALCNDGFTAEPWRGKSIHPAVNNGMLLFLQQIGYRRAFTVAGMQNKRSEKGLYRIGWDYCGSMIYFTPRGKERGWIIHVSGAVDRFMGEPS